MSRTTKRVRKPAKKASKKLVLAVREAEAVAPLPQEVPPGKLNKDQQKIIRMERVGAALALRRKGLSYEDIAKQLRVSVGTVGSLIAHGIGKLMRHDREDVEMVRRLELDRLDMMLVPLMAEITDRRTPPDVLHAAIDRVLKLQERRAKLRGLDEERGGGVVERAIEEARVALLPAIRGTTKEDLLELRAVLVKAKVRALENKEVVGDGGATEESRPDAAG